MLKERPTVFENGHPFICFRREHTEEIVGFLTQKHIDFKTTEGPARTVKVAFLSLDLAEAEQLMKELTRAIY